MEARAPWEEGNRLHEVGSVLRLREALPTIFDFHSLEATAFNCSQEPMVDSSGRR